MRVTEKEIDLGIPDSVLVSRPDLAALAWFLNFDFGGSKPKEWERIQSFFGPAMVVAKDPASAKQVQADLRKDLATLTNPKSRPSTAEADRIIWRLIQEANKTSVKLVWTVQRFEYDPTLETNAVVGKSDPETGHLVTRLRNKTAWQFVTQPGKLVTIPVTSAKGETEPVHWLVSPQSPVTAQVHPYVYGLLARLLESGELQDLRSCPECHTFFVVEDPRKEFCTAQCRDTFNNKQRQESGYFSDLRRKKRKQELKQARKLLDAGKSAEEVAAEMGLPLRVLQRESRKRALKRA